MQQPINRPGFAIPLVLLVLGFLTVGVATSFTRVQSEMRATGDHDAEARAFTYAQTGIERFAVDRRAMGFVANPPAPVESTRIALPRGWVDVIAQRVRPKTSSMKAVYLLRAKSVYQAGSMSWMPSAQYVVTQYAFYREGTMQVLSAWTSLSGLLKNGGSGTIDGSDYCGAEPPVAGVAVPDGEYTQNGGASVPTGNPPISYLGDQTQANDAVRIDWDGIVNNNLIPADYTIPGDPFPVGTFGGPDWPVVRVNGDFTLPSNGQGTLIVTGDLTIDGSEQWSGIILVGGTVFANGTNNVLGTLVSGLNEKLGITVPVSDIGNGTKTYRYDSCAIANALARYGMFVLIGRTWSNTWKSW